MNPLNRRHFLKSALAATISLGARRAFAAANLPVLYVDSLSGRDLNDGSSPSLAKRTLDGARLALEKIGGRGTIRVFAPTTDPVLGFVDFSSGQITIESRDVESAWYCERGVTTIPLGSEWEDEGGGVFSLPLAESSGQMWVSLLDRIGFLTKLNLNTSTPTAIAEGEVAYSSGMVYVHLPGDARPTDYTFKRNGVGYLLRASGSASLTVRGAVFRHAVNNAVELASADAEIVCEGCAAQYSGVGFGDSAAGRMTCRVCYSQCSTINGFNFGYATALLEDCDSSYNDWDGAAVHRKAHLTIRRSRIHSNGNTGISAHDATELNLTDVEVDYNQRGGILLAKMTSGTITDCNVHDNSGEGIACAAVGNMTVVNLISENNARPDILCGS